MQSNNVKVTQENMQMVIVTLKINHLITNKTNLIKYILISPLKLGYFYKHEVPSFGQDYDKYMYMKEYNFLNF